MNVHDVFIIFPTFMMFSYFFYQVFSIFSPFFPRFSPLSLGFLPPSHPRRLRALGLQAALGLDAPKTSAAPAEAGTGDWTGSLESLDHLLITSGYWVNYNELTASSLEIIVSKGNHPNMALFQVSELL